jgi:hypothetical protein
LRCQGASFLKKRFFHGNRDVLFYDARQFHSTREISEKTAAARSTQMSDPVASPADGSAARPLP